MLAKPNTCVGCPLYGDGWGFSQPDGLGSNGVLVLGEALGARERELGKPFVGDAGYQLNKTLVLTDRLQDGKRLQRFEFKLWNSVACQPPGNYLEGAPWEKESVAYCDQYFQSVVKGMSPKVIVPLGNVALNKLLNFTGIQAIRGYPYIVPIEGQSTIIVPTVHPAFVLRGKPEWTWVLLQDLRKAVRLAKEGWKEEETNYILQPSVWEVDQFAERARRFPCLAADIETTKTWQFDEDEYEQIEKDTIERISFSYAPKTAITIPFISEFIPAIRNILKAANQRIFWNADFDVPRLQEAAVLPGGRERILDAMELWHFWQTDLPKKLGFVGSVLTDTSEWKSTQDDRPEFYSCKDSDITFRIFEILKGIVEREGRWDTFMRYYTGFKPYTLRMTDHGVLIDQEARTEFRAELTGRQHEIEAKMQEVVPQQLKPVRRFKKPPKNVSEGDTKTYSDGKVGRWRRLVKSGC